ncbi:hypothetical protein BYT27DRAFT_6490307 [Phlegmacium glaucopus]|nr:hypothetical protein BYT27DRAFT_6490307 [Phlegmacium glaucopus]
MGQIVQRLCRVQFRHVTHVATTKSRSTPTTFTRYDWKLWNQALVPSHSAARTQSTSINRDEHEITEAHLKDKKVRVKNDMVTRRPFIVFCGCRRR